MKRREVGDGRDGVCTLRPKSRWVLGCVGCREQEERGEKERKNRGAKEGDETRGWALFLEL